MRFVVALGLALALGGCELMAYQIPRMGCGGRFTCTSDSAVDGWTGLQWARRHTLDEHQFAAEATCRALRADGHVDWRLPTIDELASLEQRSFRRKFLDPEVFSADGVLPFMSSERAEGMVLVYSYQAEVEEDPFDAGPCRLANPAGVVEYGETCEAFVRCVRGRME